MSQIIENDHFSEALLSWNYDFLSWVTMDFLYRQPRDRYFFSRVWYSSSSFCCNRLLQLGIHQFFSRADNGFMHHVSECSWKLSFFIHFHFHLSVKRYRPYHNVLNYYYLCNGGLFSTCYLHIHCNEFWGMRYLLVYVYFYFFYRVTYLLHVHTCTKTLLLGVH